MLLPNLFFLDPINQLLCRTKISSDGWTSNPSSFIPHHRTRSKNNFCLVDGHTHIFLFIHKLLIWYYLSTANATCNVNIHVSYWQIIRSEVAAYDLSHKIIVKTLSEAEIYRQIANVTVNSTTSKVNKKLNSVKVKSFAIPNSYKKSHVFSKVLAFCFFYFGFERIVCLFLVFL